MRELTVLLALQIYIDFSVARLKDGKRTGWSSGAAGKDRQIKKGEVVCTGAIQWMKTLIF